MIDGARYDRMISWKDQGPSFDGDVFNLIMV